MKKKISTIVSCMMLISAASSLSAQPLAPKAGQDGGTNIESTAIVIGVGAVIAAIILLTSEHNGHGHAHAH
jgi:hypothetical protein